MPLRTTKFQSPKNISCQKGKGERSDPGHLFPLKQTRCSLLFRYNSGTEVQLTLLKSNQDMVTLKVTSG
jgi:hypothetical protein